MKHLFILNPTAMPPLYMTQFVKAVNAAFKRLKAAPAPEKTQKTEETAEVIKTEETAKTAENKSAGEFNRLGYRIHVSKFPREAIGVIQECKQSMTADETLRVYAVGGDGEAFDCANGINGLTDTELAVIPAGHANEYASYISGGNLDNLRDIYAVITSHAAPADKIAVNGGAALNFISVGLPAFMARQTHLTLTNNAVFFGIFPPLVKICKAFIRLWALVKQRELSEREYTIYVDGKDMSGKYAAIFLLKTPYVSHGGDAFKNIKFKNGSMNYCFVRHGRNVIYNFAKMMRFRSGKAENDGKTFFFGEASHITIRSDSDITMCRDGEYFVDTEIDTRLVPGGVSLVIPGNGVNAASAELEPHNQ